NSSNTNNISNNSNSNINSNNNNSNNNNGNIKNSSNIKNSNIKKSNNKNNEIRLIIVTVERKVEENSVIFNSDLAMWKLEQMTEYQDKNDINEFVIIIYLFISQTNNIYLFLKLIIFIYLFY